MARVRREVGAASPSAPKHDGQRVFAEIARRSESFRPARETLRRVRAVPTIFPDVDRATRVGGWPIDRVAVVHGPSNMGKTLFAHGLGLSFLRRGHMYCLIDAEMTTPMPWLDSLFGPHADAGGFLASRPKSYEQAVDDVRRVVAGLVEARVRSRVPLDTSALFVVDSIRKLVPEDIIARVKQHGASGEKGSVDGYGGAAGRMRAALNAAWLDELVPLMYSSGCAILFVSREAEDPNATARDRQFGHDWKMTGGKALEFDSSLVARVSRAAFVYDGAEDEKNVVGERHRVTIRKTKVAAKQDSEEVAHFHSSNGRLAPEGFDRARDVLHVGVESGVVKRSGSWITFGGKRWQGDRRFVLSATPDQLDEVERRARERWRADAERRAEVLA